MTREPNDKDPKDPKPSDEVEAELEGPPRRDPTVEIEHAARASASAADVAPTDLQPTLTLPLWQRIVAMVAPAALGIPLVLSKTYALHVVGLGLALLAGYALVREVSTGLRAAGPVWSIRGRDIKWLPSALPAFVVFAVAAGLLWPTFIGQMPQSQDHPVHLTRAWHFVTQQLSHGQLSGWSDLWFAGWPAGEDYPPGGDYWISAVYLVTFGLLGWEAAYAVAFLGVLAACGLACYHFGRTYFGRTAGMLAGLFFLLDRGYYREGGWNYTVWWGVWPQILSTAFTILSFSTLDRVLRRGR
ncbi:MAG: hypothetical protein KC503_24130, partial [Myxococcales bacterium]|nr:hypothetical protein [Myxococcales bacterium]